MNVVFISPNFPLYYWNFCDRLKKRGVNVLGIGDASYDSMSHHCRNSLTEYYKVNSLENYDEVYRAVAFFAYKYGKIDWIESENEYWLETEASLREEFNVNTGTKISEMAPMKYKSKMKAVYEKAGIKACRYHLVNDYEGCLKFLEEVGYPVVVKPDNGVGASNTYKLKNDADFDAFYADLPPVQYIMEEFVNGEICSYDALVNSKGEVLFETGNITLMKGFIKFLEPLGHYIGLDGTILAAFLLGFPANEIVIPIMIMGYLQNGTLEEISNLRQIYGLLVQNGWNLGTAVCFLVFTISHWPCATTLYTIWKEEKKIRWVIWAVIIPAMTGMSICLVIHTIMQVVI